MPVFAKHTAAGRAFAAGHRDAPRPCNKAADKRRSLNSVQRPAPRAEGRSRLQAGQLLGGSSVRFSARGNPGKIAMS